MATGNRQGTAAGRAEGTAAANDWRDGRVVFDETALQALFIGSDGPVAKTILKKGIQVEGKAKRLCPVDTGRLRASITHNLERDDQGLVVYVGTNVKYAPFVEFGTKSTRPKPYLRPALRAVT